MSNAQLPDLLNGTVNNSNSSMGIDAKQLLKNLGSLGSFGNETNNDDWESAFKYLMNKNSYNKHYEDHQQEDWLRFQEMRKQQSNMSGGSGSNHFNNMFNSEYTFFFLTLTLFNIFKILNCAEKKKINIFLRLTLYFFTSSFITR